MTSEIKPEDVKLPEPAQERVYFCNKCGHFGAVGPSHVGCDYYATGSDPFFTADQVRAAVLEDRQRRALSDDDLRLILAKLENYDDCGPSGEGWQSDDLSRLVAKLAAAIRAGHSVTETKRD